MAALVPKNIDNAASFSTSNPFHRPGQTQDDLTPYFPMIMLPTPLPLTPKNGLQAPRQQATEYQHPALRGLLMMLCNPPGPLHSTFFSVAMLGLQAPSVITQNTGH